MSNYNQKDFENAINVLRQIKKYIKAELGEDVRKDGFPRNIKLVKLKNCMNDPHRGGHEVWFVANGVWGGILSVAEFYRDGTEFDKEINTETKSKHGNGVDYLVLNREDSTCYNTDEQKTIEYAASIASRWSEAKEALLDAKRNFEANNEWQSKTLENFKI